MEHLAKAVAKGGRRMSIFGVAGAWAMGILLGIKLFFVGLTMLVGGSAVRSLAANR